MSEFKIGQSVKPKYGQAYPCIVIAFSSNGLFTSEPTDFVVVAVENNLLATPVTLHHSLLEQAVQKSDGPSVH